MSAEAATGWAPRGSDRGWRRRRRRRRRLRRWNRRGSRPGSRRWRRRGARPEASRRFASGAWTEGSFVARGRRRRTSQKSRESRESRESRQTRRTRGTRRSPRPRRLFPCARREATAAPTGERPRSASTNMARRTFPRPRRAPEEGLSLTRFPRCTRTRLWWSTSPIRRSPTRCDGACNRRAPVCFGCTRRVCRRGRCSCRDAGFTTGRGFGRWPGGCSCWCRCCP